MISPGRRLLTVLSLAVVCTRHPAATAADIPPDSLRERSQSVLFLLEVSPFFSSSSNYSDGGYTASLGVGYQLSRRFSLSVIVYTGKDQIPESASTPVGGMLEIGGAGVEGTVFFVRSGTIRPYATAGLALYTILRPDQSGNGYNGNGFSIGLGVQAEFLEYFSANLTAKLARSRFFNPVGDLPSRDQFEPFQQTQVGAAFRIIFYPSVL
jgi:hypothetical protein